MPRVKPSRPEVAPRRARARATEWRIVKAAFGLFCEHGYAGTTMAQIAEAAGVAVQTVYFVFHTKAAVLSRAYDFAVMGEDEPQLPWDQPWYRDMVAADDVVEALRHLVAGVGDITRRLTPLYVVASGSAAGDPDVAVVVDRHERWRVDGYRGMLDVLRTKSPLRDGLSPERANDLLLLYAGMDVYHALVEILGWSHDEWAAWTRSTLALQLFAIDGVAARGRFRP
jgi:AcrR family transcriptional regulator